MSDFEEEKIAVPRRQSKVGPRWLPPILFLLVMLFGSDFDAFLYPLRQLGAPYPGALDYAKFILPGLCALLWLAMRRRWPNTADIGCVLLSFWLLALIPACAEHYIAKIPLRTWLETAQLDEIERATGFPVAESGDSHGSFLVVARDNETKARSVIQSMNLLWPDASATP